jgi:ribosomal protein S18 acetylase RimI-like enzyme
MKIHPLQQVDASFLCSIFKDNEEYYEIFFDSNNTLTEWNNRVKHFLNKTVVNHFIIEANSNKVGWISFLDTETAERELCILVISKEHLRCGYGSQSLLWLIEKSKADNMRNLLLNVNQNNTRAIKFYQNFGFRIVGEEVVPECNEAVNLAQYKMMLSLL